MGDGMELGLPEQPLNPNPSQKDASLSNCFLSASHHPAFLTPRFSTPKTVVEQ